MTLGIALRSGDCIVLAADKLQTCITKSGNYTESVCKLKRIGNDHAFSAAGPSHAENLFCHVAADILKGKQLFPGFAGYLGEKLQVKFKNRHPRKLDREQNHMSFLLVGTDDENELSIDHFESPNFFPFAVHSFKTIGMGKQSTYFLKRIYDKTKPEYPTVKQLVQLACFCISETSKQDPAVGKEIDIWIIRKVGEIEKIPADQIMENLKKADEISELIVQQFL